MWMMDSSIAYNSNCEEKNFSNVQMTSETEVPVPDTSVPFHTESTSNVSMSLHSWETTEKINLLKDKAVSAFSKIGSHEQEKETNSENSFKEKITSTFSKISSQEYANRETSGIPQATVLYAVIGVMTLVIVVGGISFASYIRKNQNSQESLSSDTPVEPVKNWLAENSADIPATEAFSPVSSVIQNTPVLLSTGTGTSAEKVYSDFYQILQKSDAPGGYLYDIDHDGKDDMILKDTDKMDFILYTHDKSGNLSMTHFGSFLAWGDDDFYDITGTDGIHYIYYYDEYMHHSIQGVFNPQTGNELDFSDGYSEEEIQNMLSQAGFQTKGGNYSKLEMLYYDALCQKTAPVETIPATEKRNPPSISCEIKGQISEMDGGGYYYKLYVSGNYDYYHIECVNHGFDGNSDNIIVSGNKTESELHLSSSSRMEYITASVTPYYSDGTKGKTITCEASQPEQKKTTTVPTPSTCVWMGRGTPVSSDGFLNLRSSKSISSDSNIITQIPNGATISMYYIGDSDWIYVEYGSYSGYVKEKYTKLTDPQGLWADGPGEDEEIYANQEATVYVCYGVGEINGTGVPGYSTSYIVNGGSKSTVRKELGNGWHVTTSQYCYANGKTWYELYDTDDGDYYGWVDSGHIKFYEFYDGP